MKKTVLLLATLLLTFFAPLHAELGMAREAYGVWDRSGFNTVSQYPYTRGQELNMSWAAVHTARGQYDWSAIDAQLQFAEDQNELFTCKVGPIDGTAPGKSMPPWMFGPLTANGGGLDSFSEIADPAQPTKVPAPYVYAKYTEPQFQIYFEEMVKAFANYVRNQVSPGKQSRIAYVRVDTGATGDEEPYENPSLVPLQYQISTLEWQNYRLWVFEVYRKAFQEGPGPVIPLMFVSVEPLTRPTEWSWILTNVKGGFGTKFGGQVRGHHLSESQDVPTAFKSYSADPESGVKLFSRNEMDQTFTKPYFQLNVRLGMYWVAVEQLNCGMSIWDITDSCLKGPDVASYVESFEFFNQWSGELIPGTAGGGFCILHEGLDSSNGDKFPTATFGGGSLSRSNTARYTAICNAYSGQGAQMDDLNGATMLSVAQRDDTPGMIGYNDAGWGIVPGNYDRFITQINPDTTSKGIWRINGLLTTSSHPYDRFARRSDNASGMNTMSFNIHDSLLPTVGQRVQMNVTYFDRGTGQFNVVYDAVGNSQKTALTVTKTSSNTWMTQSVVVTDWFFGNRGTNSSDLQLVNLATDPANPDTIFHGIEVIKLADVWVGTVGQGTVTGRNNAAAFSAIPSSVMEGQRLELKATPAPGWRFTGWSGALTGTNPNPFLFPTKDTRLTATFAYGLGGSSDNFNSGTWTDGIGWSDSWISGTNSTGIVSLLSTPASMAELNGGTGIAKITRTLDTPLTSATLSFDWDLDRIGGSDIATVDVYNGSSWINVWTQIAAGPDASNTPELVTSGNISLTGTISQVRFVLNANQSGDTFFIDNVSVTGTPSITPSGAPLFSSDPIGKSAAAVGVAYTGQTLASSATDPNSNPLTFSKLAGGPAWLSIATNGSLSGTPLAANAGLNSWNVQVSSSGGTDTAMLLINVVMPGPNPPTALAYSSPTAYTRGTAITNISPTSGGGGVMRYVVSPALPNGLRLNGTTGVISGTPTAVTPTATYTVTASNTDGSTTATVNLTVNDIAPTALTYSRNPASYTTGATITNNTPTNSGGTVVSYAVSPALPAGLSLNTATGVISGTPTTVTLVANYTITATNTGGSTTASVSIEVKNLPPTALTYSNNPVTYTLGVPITDNTPSSSGGAVVSYSVSPALPAGLTLNTTTGVISGTPTAVKNTAVYTVSATNINGSATAGVTITVIDVPPSTLSYSNNPAVYTVGTALTNATRSSPTSSGGAVVSYSISPSLPTGMSMNSIGETQGTPTAATPTTVYTVTAANSGGSTTASLTITVNAISTIAPSNLTYSINPATYTKGTAIANNTPSSTGGAVASYGVSPALPAGLMLNPTTGVITGTPTAVTATASYTVTATNSAGSTTASLSITVKDIAPTALTYSSNPATYTKGTAISNNTPTSSGGAVVSYSLSFPLPAGLTLNSTTGVISGTPTTATVAANYMVTATNSGGSVTASVNITINNIATTYTNASLITIRDYNTASLYPSSITVPTTTGTIAKVTVLLNGFSHTYPSDVAILLVGPAGQKFLLMYKDGGGTDAVNANLTFDDSASAILPNSIVTGSYKPSSYTGNYSFPSPAPANPYSSGALSVFNGTNPTGAWSLYVTDISKVDSGSISGGWSLSITTTPPAISAPAGLSYSANPATYTKGAAIASNSPTSTGGPVVSYAVSPSLPAGLALNTSTGVISGTPTAITSTANYTVTATNTSGSTSTLVSMRVNDAAPSALAYSSNPAVYTKGTAITTNTPSSGGGPVVSYAVSPALPTGLNLNTTTGVITGTPTVMTAATNYTVTATNTGGSATVLLSITVNDVAPSALTYSSNPASYIRGTAISNNTPTSGGGAVDSYAVSPALPAGLALNTSTGVISGTPTAVNSSASYTVTATNTGGSTTALLSITVNDVAPSALTYSSNPASYTKGTPITYNTPTNGGGAVTSYSVSPVLPPDLTLNTTTGIISGTPTAVTSTASYTVTGTNTGGSTTASVSITVNEAAPSALTYSSNPATYTKGTAIPNNTPANSGGAVASYSVSPALPAGLTLNTTTGVISGTPTAVTSTASYAITATNNAGFTTAAVSIRVNDVAPSALTYSTNPATYLKDTAVPANTPNSSGGSVVSYAVSPSPPAGLALDTSTGVISGTPTAASSPANYTVTASNSGGSTTVLLSITVSEGATTFATSGTWTCPSGVTLLQVECWGGGGAGGLATRNGQISNTACGGGGAGGAYAKLNYYPVTPGVTYYVNVGAGGVSAATDTAKVPGGDSWFNSVNSPSATIIAKGGAGGETVFLLSAANRYGAGGTGTASGSVGDVVNAGGSGVMTTANAYGGAGGGSGGSGNTSGGNSGITPATTLGVGAVAVSNGIGGNGGNGGISGAGSGLSPTTSPGGGGGGARCGSGSTFSGGVGAAGRVVLTVTSSPAPSTLTYSNNPATYTMGAAITNNTPTSSGGAVASYAVSPALPTGLSLNTVTGVISGTPTVVVPTATYTVTATNNGGFTTAGVNIAVVSAYTAWSSQYSLVQGPNGDDDGDGNSNYFEFIAGLDPTNRGSVFNVRTAPVAGQPNQVAIIFNPIVNGRTYTVKCTGSLTSGTWSALTGSTTSDAGSERTVTDTGASGSNKFYKVEVSLP